MHLDIHTHIQMTDQHPDRHMTDISMERQTHNIQTEGQTPVKNNIYRGIPISPQTEIHTLENTRIKNAQPEKCWIRNCTPWKMTEKSHPGK